MSTRAAPLVVGAGPAGIRAAEALVKAGLRPLVVDEAPACGGQVYRQPPLADGRGGAALYGSEAAKAVGLHRGFAALADRIDYCPNGLVWNLRDGIADIAVDGSNRQILNRQVVYDGLILATGAIDRVLPIPGWTLPGVFTLGATQIALKAQGCAIGTRVVCVGSGPLLYLVAWQYRRAGVAVVAVLDTAPLAAKLHLLRGLPLAPAIVLRGLRMAAELKLRGTALHHGVENVRIEGGARVERIAWRQRGRDKSLACDGIGYGLGLRPETQLADLAGCAFRFDRRDRGWLPARDASGRSSVPGVYLAGDGAGIVGADAAERAGELAALALLHDRGLPQAAPRTVELERDLNRSDRVRDVLAAAFPYPAHWSRQLAGDTLICRCEEVGVDAARRAISDYALTELNRFKAISRIGMGRCQGRVCGAAAAEFLAQETAQDIAAVGRLRTQAPVKPIPFGLTTSSESRELAT